MRQATEEELEGLMNGWRELEIGEHLRRNMKARERGGGHPWHDITVSDRAIEQGYNPMTHKILCVEAE